MIKKILIGSVCVFGLFACSDGLSNREESCLDHGGSWEQCTSEGHQRNVEAIRAQGNTMGQGMSTQAHAGGYNADYYPPVQQGQAYTNHYGNEQYGYWDQQGSYQFNDPYGPQASSTNGYLLAAGLGGLATYALTSGSSYDSWSDSNPRGYSSKSYTAKSYIGKSGKTISKTDYLKRKAQSAKDKAKYLAKKGATAANNAYNKSKPALQKGLTKAKEIGKVGVDKAKVGLNKTQQAYQKAKPVAQQKASQFKRKAAAAYKAKAPVTKQKIQTGWNKSKALENKIKTKAKKSYSSYKAKKKRK